MKNKIQKIGKKAAAVLTGAIVSMMPFVTNMAFAQNIEFKNPIKHKSIEELAIALLDIAIQIGAVIAVFMFILAGFNFVTAQGDTGKIQQARTALLWTAVGTVVLLGAKAILVVIQNTVAQF